MQNDLWGSGKFLIFAGDEIVSDNNASCRSYVQFAALGSTAVEGGGCGDADACGWSQCRHKGKYGSDGLDGVHHGVRQLQDARFLARQLREPYAQSGGGEGYGVPDFETAESEGSGGVRTR